jgi:hypothetical protein
MSTVNKRSFGQLAGAFVAIDADRSLILHEALSLFGDAPTYDAYMAARAEIIAGYILKRPAATTEAQNTFFSRFMAAIKSYASENEYAIELPKKPASTSEAATKKAEQRKAEKPEAVKAAELALATTKAQAKEAAQAATKANNEKRDAFIAFFKALSEAERDTFYALRDKRFGVVLQVMPANEIEAALTVQRKAEAAIKAAAKQTKAKATA